MSLKQLEEFSKSGGPYIGPRGGKWADAKHTIPWQENKKRGKEGVKDATKIVDDLSENKGLGDNPLPGLPNDTELKDLLGLAFSKWGGKLALVEGSDYRDRRYPDTQFFNPELENLAHRYYVRYAIDLKTKEPLSAHPSHLGHRPEIQRGDKPYTLNSFTVGKNPMYGGYRIQGGFAERKEVWVKTSFKDLNDQEKYLVEKHLQTKGYKEISVSKKSSSYATPSEWKDIINMPNFEATQNVPTEKYHIANAVESLLENIGVDTTDIVAADKAWKELPGIYFVNNKGVLKTVVSRDKKVFEKMNKAVEVDSSDNDSI